MKQLQDAQHQEMSMIFHIKYNNKRLNISIIWYAAYYTGD